MYHNINERSIEVDYINSTFLHIVFTSKTKHYFGIIFDVYMIGYSYRKALDSVLHIELYFSKDTADANVQPLRLLLVCVKLHDNSTN